MSNIGDEVREREFQPIEQPIPQRVPAPSPVPASPRPSEPVPA